MAGHTCKAVRYFARLFASVCFRFALWYNRIFFVWLQLRFLHNGFQLPKPRHVGLRYPLSNVLLTEKDMGVYKYCRGFDGSSFIQPYRLCAGWMLVEKEFDLFECFLCGHRFLSFHALNALSNTIRFLIDIKSATNDNIKPSVLNSCAPVIVF